MIQWFNYLKQTIFNYLGKRKFDGTHLRPGGTKRRYKHKKTNRESQPLIQHRVGKHLNGTYNKQFYQDSYMTWS